MSTTNAFHRRPGVCMSLRRVGDVYEVAFDDVRLRQETSTTTAWEHERTFQFTVLTPDELEGKISQERCAKLGFFIIDLLSYLARKQERTSE